MHMAASPIIPREEAWVTTFLFVHLYCHSSCRPLSTSLAAACAWCERVHARKFEDAWVYAGCYSLAKTSPADGTTIYKGDLHWWKGLVGGETSISSRFLWAFGWIAVSVQLKSRMRLFEPHNFYSGSFCSKILNSRHRLRLLSRLRSPQNPYFSGEIFAKSGWKFGK